MTRTKLTTHAAWVVLFLLAGGCGDSREDLNVLSPEAFHAQVEEARQCDSGDTCVLAGSARCLCATPVNASRAQEVDDLASQVECGNLVVDCVLYEIESVRCEANRCTADIRR